MKRFAGESTFVWFLATVTNVNDPDKLGLCQIRIDNFHDDYEDEDLPWAHVMLPVTSASYQTDEYGEVGTSPTGILVGSWVFGFFADGSSARVPFIVGTIPAIKEDDVNKHDVPKEAREINTWQGLKKPIGPEPKTAYAAKYPFNKVKRTLSGHVIEIDDTPHAERIHVYHKSGTYVEISEDGRTVTRINGNNFTIMAKNNEVYIQQNSNTHILGTSNTHVEKDMNVIVNGNVNIKIDGNLKIQVGGTCDIQSGGNMTLKAPKIDLNP